MRHVVDGTGTTIFSTRPGPGRRAGPGEAVPREQAGRSRASDLSLPALANIALASSAVLLILWLAIVFWIFDLVVD